MRIPHNKIVWSDDELKFLKNNYQTLTNNELAIKLNRTRRTICRKLGELKLYRTVEEKQKLKSRINKRTGRDLSRNNLITISKSYKTRGEFYQKDPSAYSRCIKNGWDGEMFSHMTKSYSTPQLILKNILETILNSKCSYNDRKAIKPLEIDCYFGKWKIGWEYDGRYFHNHEKDERKKHICNLNGITLFNIHENNKDYRDYERNIKNQILLNLETINSITNGNISPETILNHKVVIELPDLLTEDEVDLVKNNSLSNIKKIDPLLCKKIMRYKLYTYNELNITNDFKKYKKFNNYEEFLLHITNKNYSSFTELCKLEHPHRLLKKWNIPIEKIHEIYRDKITK